MVWVVFISYVVLVPARVGLIFAVVRTVMTRTRWLFVPPPTSHPFCLGVMSDSTWWACDSFASFLTHSVINSVTATICFLISLGVSSKLFLSQSVIIFCASNFLLHLTARDGELGNGAVNGGLMVWSVKVGTLNCDTIHKPQYMFNKVACSDLCIGLS